MRVLVTGRGTSGSWAVRGEQLGRAIGATVQPRATDPRGYDAVVVVKRDCGIAERARAAGVPLIWDIVDAWPQPAGNEWSIERSLEWLREAVRAMRPDGIVAATQAMAHDCNDFGVPVLVLPHHARPGQARNQIRERVETIGYEGAPHYLGRWAQVVERECARRGWRFVVNPPALADLDVVVALRDAHGYAPRAWKSGVKLANAQGSGTPFVGVRERGYTETACGVELWAIGDDDLARAFDKLKPQARRREIGEQMWRAHPALASVAATYGAWLQRHFTRATA